MDSLHAKLQLSTNEIFLLERQGRYAEAVHELRSIWKDKSLFPDTDGLSNAEEAEVLLRCGSLLGFLGHNDQIPNSQEHSKNLITEAHQRFLEIYDLEKVAECENYLALAYWRCGEVSEAEFWVDEALSKPLPNSSFARIYSVITKSGNLLSERKYEEMLILLDAEKDPCLEFGDDCLKADFHNQYGLALKNLGKFSLAVEFLEKAKEHHKKTGHRTYLGSIENNIAMIYKSLRDFENAHAAIDRSLAIQDELRAYERFGFSLDTKALIFLDEGKVKKALDTVDEAIQVLKKGENFEYLIETLSTKMEVLIRMNRFGLAALILSEAINLAKVRVSEVKANRLAERFGSLVQKANTPALLKIHTEDKIEEREIDLELSPELAHYNEFQGVWIKNRHLESSGIRKNSLAIVVSENVSRGDLIVVLESDTERVSSGYYDYDFGIVSLQGDEGEPQLFEESDIQILGKIVGVAERSGKNNDKMFAKPI